MASSFKAWKADVDLLQQLDALVVQFEPDLLAEVRAKRKESGKNQFSIAAHQPYLEELAGWKADSGPQQHRAKVAFGNHKVVRTEALVTAWENAHSHINGTETYQRVSGRIVIYTWADEREVLAVPHVLTSGTSLVIHPAVAHKVWMDKGAVMFTVGRGTSGSWACKRTLDKACKAFNPTCVFGSG